MYQVVSFRNKWIQPNYEIPENIGKFFARVETSELKLRLRFSNQEVPLHKFDDRQSFVEDFGLTEHQEQAIFEHG